jgi:hypothetical protein
LKAHYPHLITEIPNTSVMCIDRIENIVSSIPDAISHIYQQTNDLIGNYISDDVFRITIAFVPGLLSISYPLIVQTISRLNDQYKSTHIIDTFRKELRHKWFFWSLICSVLFTLLCVTKFKGLILLDFILIINLLLAFFLNIRLLLTYQSGKELFHLYRRRLNITNYEQYKGKPKLIKRKKSQILGAWHSVIDLYCYAIAGRDRKLQEDIRINVIASAFHFIKYVEQKDQEVVLFPTEMYNSTYDIIATFIRNKDDNYYQNIEFFVGSAFFSSDHENRQFLHQQTFQALWSNLFLLIENDRDDKVVRHWENAHQYCRFNLEILQIQRNEKYEETEESKEYRKKLNTHKSVYIQIYTVLGAYLMHKKKYKTLYKVWFFTQSQPPSYVLVVQTMADIFQQYFVFLELGFFDSNFTIRYYFKDLEFDAMNGRKDVRTVIRTYLCLLFLKQWLTPTQYGYSRLTIPQLPESQSDKKHWEGNIKYFRNKVNRILEDSELLKALNLDWITPEECANRSLPYPIDFLNNLEQALEEGFQETLNNLELDPALTKEFDDSTIALIKEAHDTFSRINGGEISKADRDVVSDTMQAIRGTRTAIDKEALVANTSSSYVGFQTFLGGRIKEEYCNHISIKFSTNTSIHYEVKQEELFMAIDRLKLKPDEHAIVAFNSNMEYLAESGGITLQAPTSNEDYIYNGIPIYEFQVNIPFEDNTLYVLRQADFPMIRHRDWTEIENMDDDAKQWWQNLELIDEELKIYRKFTNLNDDEVQLNKYINDHQRSEAELRNMVDINVDFLGYCWFKKGVKIVSIKAAGVFQEGGIKNTLHDIESF